MEKTTKTGSVPRTPGTPLDAKPPKRLEDVISYIQFFRDRPTDLKEASPEEITNFLGGLQDQLQRGLQEDHLAAQALPREWSRTRSLQEIGQHLVWAANHATAIKHANPERLASIFSAWAAAVRPFTDDGESTVPPFTTRRGQRIAPEHILPRLVQVVESANERPGRAWRLLAETTDQYRSWTEQYLEEDSDDESRQKLQQLGRKPSARQLKEQAEKRFEPRDTSPSPVPEFHERWPRIRPTTEEPVEAEGSFQVPPRPTEPRPGQSESLTRIYETQVPQIIRTAPTFPINKPATYEPPALPHQEGHYETPEPTPEPKDTEIVDVERRRVARLGRRAREETPIEERIRPEERRTPPEERNEPKLRTGPPSLDDLQETGKVQEGTAISDALTQEALDREKLPITFRSVHVDYDPEEARARRAAGPPGRQKRPKSPEL